ncbi:CENPX protein, partial [Vireo altiloquus]|nr:CENPX protein [Vireo altiloquus]
SSVPLSVQDTVDRLLRLHFRDGRTRGTAAEAAGGSGRRGPSPRLPSPPCRCKPSHCSSLSSPCAAEAAARAARQAQAEDLKKVDTEQLEKVLPQLVCNR